MSSSSLLVEPGGHEAKATSYPSGRNESTSESERGDMCQGTAEMSYSARQCKSEAEGDRKTGRTLKKQQLSNKLC